MAQRKELLRSKKSNEIIRSKLGITPRNTQKILIISEGEVEKSYFIKTNTLFRRKAIEIECLCSEIGNDALSIVDFAISKKSKYSKDDDIKSVWCVFDVDKNGFDKIHQALTKAKKNKINICISNICFEIWLICHYSYSTGEVVNGDAAKSLIKNYIKNYDSSRNFFHNNPEIFEELMSKKDIAIKNSQDLDNFHNKEFPEYYEKGFLIRYDLNRNPSTHVYKLINEIFEILQKETI